jgi:putative ABC transport system permease protein
MALVNVLEGRGEKTMETLWQDVRFGMRALRRHHGFAAIAIATLALGIGANAAMFAVVNAILLRPLRFSDADRLVRVTADMTGLGTADIGMSPPELYDYRDRADLFDAIAGIYPIDANLTEVDEPERVEVLLVSPSYFAMLGARPALGRIFNAGYNHPGIAEVVVISDGLWRRRFAGRPDVLGRKLKIDGDWYEVVGVMPPDFHHPGRVLRTGIDMWAPTGYRAAPFQPLEKSRAGFSLGGAIARLKPGITLEDARARLDAFGAQLRAEYPNAYPERAGWTPRMIPLQEDVVGRSGTVLTVMLAAVGLVLVIACANIAGLLLARGADRQRELGIRRAMGAGRLRLVRLLLVESFLVAAAGGFAGLLLAFWAKDLILAVAPYNLPRAAEITIDVRVVTFATAIASATGLLFGLVPAWQFSKPNVLGALKDAPSAASPAKQRARSVLVVAECALAMVLLVGAALLVRSFWRVMQVNPGLDPRGVVTARIWLPQPNEPSAGKYFKHQARLPVYEEVLRRVRELPGVETAAIARSLPLDGQRGLSTITIEGAAVDAASDVPTMLVNVVSIDYFSVMRIPIEQGRGFSAADGPSGLVVAVNAEAARRYFAGQDPIGRRIHFGRPREDPTWMTIVGVVGNVLNETLEHAPRPMIYVPLAQSSSLAMAVVARTKGDTAALAASLGKAVRAVDPDVPAFAVRTMDEIVAASTAARRFAIRLVGGFAALALLLAAIGIYGVMAYLVGQRTREIGIRVALGAHRRWVVQMIVARAVVLVMTGVVIGGAASLVATDLIAEALFGIAPWDPWSFATIAILLTLTAVAASAAPALRAARVDPIVALRAE